MSAYLDGELAPKQMREFERDIQQYPDLFAELQTLQRLNKLALDSKVPLPDDRYFDKLAGQIDSQIKRESPQDRGRFVNFLLERRKTVAIVSSVAAVFLVAIIGMNLFGPSAKRYPQEIRNIELKPAIIEKPKTDTVTIWPEHEQQIVPPPVVDDEIKRDSVARRPRTNEAEKNERQSSSSSVNVPSLIIRQEPAPPVPVPDTITQEYGAVEHRVVTPHPTVKPSETTKHSLTESQKSTSPATVDLQNSIHRSGIASPPQRVDSIVVHTEPFVRITAGSERIDDVDPKSVGPDTAQFRDKGNRSLDVYISAFNSTSRGVFDGWRLTALATSRDSLQAWVDSIHAIGPELWYAEQAYRSLQQKDISWENYQLWRAYIDYYLADTPDADRTLWNRRLTILNEILERFLGKQIQH